MNLPLVSVIIANYNGKEYVTRCIQSVLASDYENLEVVVVDDVSSDNSLKDIEGRFGGDRRVKIIRNETNLDFVGTNNKGIKSARGEYLILLNNDTEVEPGWLKEIIATMQRDSAIGIAQPKLLMLKDKKRIDTCGHFMSFFGLPYEIGAGEEDFGQYDLVADIFGCRGAALAIRRDILDKIGALDEEYRVFGEDTDLSWRSWLGGFRVVFVPKSIVYHKGGATLNPSSLHRVFYHGTKNNIRTLIKNLELINLFWMLPLHLACRLAMALLFMLKGRISDACWILKGIFWNLKNYRKNREARRSVQNSVRRVRDVQIFPVMFGDLSVFSMMKKGLSWMGRI